MRLWSVQGKSVQPILAYPILGKVLRKQRWLLSRMN